MAPVERSDGSSAPPVSAPWDSHPEAPGSDTARVRPRETEINACFSELRIWGDLFASDHYDRAHSRALGVPPLGSWRRIRLHRTSSLRREATQVGAPSQDPGEEEGIVVNVQMPLTGQGQREGNTDGPGKPVEMAEESCRKHRTSTRTWAAKAKGEEQTVKQDGDFIVAKTWACERERGLLGRRVSRPTCSPRCNCNRGGPLIH